MGRSEMTGGTAWLANTCYSLSRSDTFVLPLGIRDSGRYPGGSRANGPGSAGAMAIGLLRGSARKLVAASVAVGIMVAAAVAVTIWRYEVAVGLLGSSNDASVERSTTETLVATFWHEREAMHGYLIAPSPAAFAEVGAERVYFADMARSRNPADMPAEAKPLAQAVAANDGFYALFTGIRGTTATTLGREVAGTAQLNASEGSVARGPARWPASSHNARMRRKRRPLPRRPRRSGSWWPPPSWPWPPVSHSCSSPSRSSAGHSSGRKSGRARSGG